MNAIISECGQYRYRLDRDVGMYSGPTYAFFGVNPSTADATLDDATVRKWTGFVKTWGGRRFIVGNVFAYRATDVGELATAADPWGADNSHHIQQIMAEADVLVPCWGSRSKLPPKLRSSLDEVGTMLRSLGKPCKVFGITASGDPKHPLMLGYSTQMMEWK